MGYGTDESRGARVTLFDLIAVLVSLDSGALGVSQGAARTGHVQTAREGVVDLVEKSR